MIGYIQKANSDVYVFFEGDDIARLSAQRNIEGIFAHNDLQGKGVLKVVVDEEACRQKGETVWSVRDSDGQRLTVMLTERVFKQLRERETVEPHLGFQHIILRGVNNMSMQEQYNYATLRRVYPK